MEPCSNCGGFGLLMNGEDVTDCYECRSGMVEARDERGRFLPWVPLEGLGGDPQTGPHA